MLPLALHFVFELLRIVSAPEFVLGVAASQLKSSLFDRPASAEVVQHKSSVSSLEDWRMQTVPVVVGSVYIGSAVWNLSINKLLENGWNNWRSDLSLQELQEISSKKLYDQLCEAITLKYNSFNSEFCEQFLSETGKELTALTRYVGVGLKLQTFKIGSLLLFSEKKLKRAIRSIQRLKYMRLLFYRESHEMLDNAEMAELENDLI